MDKSTLKMFLTVLLEFLKPKLGPVFYAMIKSVLDKMLADFVQPIGAAPDQLKDWVKQYLLEYAAKIPVPFVAGVVTRVINSLDGVILDYLWDLVQARLLGQPVLMGTTPEVAAFTVSFDDLLAD